MIHIIFDKRFTCITFPCNSITATQYNHIDLHPCGHMETFAVSGNDHNCEQKDNEK